MESKQQVLRKTAWTPQLVQRVSDAGSLRVASEMLSKKTIEVKWRWTS